MIKNKIINFWEAIRKAKSEKRLLKAVRRHAVPRFVKRFQNNLFFNSLSKSASKYRSDAYFDMPCQNGYYFGINLPLIKTDKAGRFIFPEGTKRAMIDVGSSVDWPNSVDWLNRHPEDSVVVGVEPNIDSWCIAKAMHYFAKEPELLFQGHYVEQKYVDRIFFIPAAIGNLQGYIEFNSNQSVGSSSILASHMGNVDSRTAEFLETKRQNLVPVMKLEEILKRIPENIEYIEFLKVDTEGFDFEVIKSAGDLIKKCAVISVEIACHNAFVHSYIVKDMIDYIKNKGFHEIESAHGDHGTVSFVNSKYKNILDKFDHKLRN